MQYVRAYDSHAAIVILLQIFIIYSLLVLFATARGPHSYLFRIDYIFKQRSTQSSARQSSTWAISKLKTEFSPVK